MREIIKLAGVLFVITALAAVLLGFTNLATEAKIAQQLEQEDQEARQAALPTATDFEKIDNPELDSALQTEFEIINEVYAGKKDNEIVGYTFKASPGGYGGEIVLNIGISIEGKLTGIKVVSHAETPGLGAKATEENFQNQYNDKPIDSPLAVVKTTPVSDNEVEAITGATITSSAVTNGVNTAIDLFIKFLK